MLSDLTLDTCVPILRCRVAHRMHKKMPNCPMIVSYSAIVAGEIIESRVGEAGEPDSVLTYTP